jgi:hypothetical protein
MRCRPCVPDAAHHFASARAAPRPGHVVLKSLRFPSLGSFRRNAPVSTSGKAMLIAFPRVGARDRARGSMGMAAILLHNAKQPGRKPIASSEWRIEAVRALAILVLTFRISICSPPSASPFPIRYSPILLASVSLSNSPTPDEELAERRWRSDACEAPVSACHDRHADASRSAQARGRPALRSLRTTGGLGLRSISANRASPTCGEAPCVPSDGTLASSALHRGDFRPGPVLAVVRHSLQDRAPTLFDARVIVTRRSGSRGPPKLSARWQTASGDATPRSALQDRL